MINLPEGCKDPVYKGKNLTNRVLIQQVDLVEKKKITYYCPAYLRLQIKNFSNMSFEDLEAAINSVLVLTVNFRGVMPVLQQKIRPMLKLGFNRDDSLQIKQSSKSRAISMNMKQGGIYVYTIHKRIHVAIKQDVFLSPFEMIYLIMSVYIKDIQVNSSMINQIVQEIDLQIIKAQMEKEDKIREYGEMFVTPNLGLIKKVLADSKEDRSKLTEEDKKFMELPPQVINMKMELYKEATDFMNSEVKTLDLKLKAFQNEKKFLDTIDSFHFRFNFMDTDIQNLKISYSAEGTYGNYDLAESLLKAEYTNISVAKRIRSEYENKMEKAKKDKGEAGKEYEEAGVDHSRIKPFNYAHFQIPLYKKPSVALTTIFFPLWLLVVIMLGIYFQDTGLANRIGSLAGLMIAFVALIPVIREQLPQSPNVTMVEILVYLQIFTGILVFIQSISVRNLKDYVFDWTSNGLFLASAIILALQLLIIIIFMFLHGCKWEPSYNAFSYSSQVSFKWQKWDNLACDKHFRRKIDNYRVQILSVDKEIEQIKQFIDKLTDKEKEEYEEIKSEKEEKEAMAMF